jgi:uncharacterized membrane protein YkoI
MRLAGKLTLCAWILLAITVIPPAVSQEPAPEGARYSLDDAVALVKEQLGGRVLRAETSLREDRIVYQIRIITDDGRVRTIDVDAQNGIED